LAGAAEEIVDEFIPKESLQASLKFHRGSFLYLGRNRGLEGDLLAIIRVVFDA